MRELKLIALKLPAGTDERLRAMLIFDDLAQYPPERRARELATIDLSEEVAKRLREMLRTDGQVPTLMAAAAKIDLDSSGSGDALANSILGTRIGTFRLVEVLGQGGSSVVFRAERQSGDGNQIVALKLLRTGLYSADSQGRFRREQTLLARLTHPNIATLIEGGVSSAGIPYIAMELVDGLPITRAAEARALNVHQRLSWFVTLCRAIEAAHTALVIHRDLKPSNVLVANDGTIKVVDFGIAKIAGLDDGVTQTQTVALTPEYAAPEQFAAAALTTSVDIYALGVILAELLTGKRLRGDVRASGAVAADSTAIPMGLPSRRALNRVLRGDLDNVLAKALADEPAMRYRSAGAFADDIEYFLEGRAVRAHPPSRWYSARKFVERNRLVVALSTVFVCTIFFLLLVTLDRARAASEQARRANAQAERAEAARDLLVSAFDAAGADLPKDKRPSVQDIVDQATSKLEQKTHLPDALRVDLLLTLARVSKSVGSYDHALSMLDRIDEIAKGQQESDSLWWQAVALRGSVLVEKGQMQAAIGLLGPLREKLSLRKDASGVDGLLTLGKALLHNGNAKVGLQMLQAAVVNARAIGQQDLVLRASIEEATQLMNAQHFSDGLDHAEGALKLWHEQNDTPSQSIIELYGTIALASEATGDIERAEKAYRDAIALGDRFFDKPNPASAWNVGMYGSFLIAQGRFADGEPYARRGLQMRQEVFGEADPRTLNAVATMGKFHAGKHEFASAIEWLTQGIDTCRAHSVRDVICPRILAFRGRARGRLQQFPEAESDLHEALAWQRDLGGDDNPAYAFVLDNLLVIQVVEHRYAEALETADSVLAINGKYKGGMIQSDLSTRFYRATALFHLDRNIEALNEMLRIEPQYSTMFPSGVSRFDMLALKARALARANRSQDAQQAAKAALTLQNKPSHVDQAVRSELQRILVARARPK